MGKTPEVLMPALRQYRHNYGSEQYIAGFDYDETVKTVRDLEQQLEDANKEADKWAAAYRDSKQETQRVTAEIQQQLSTLRYAMKKIATGEHSNPALAAKRALKERDNE